MIVIWPCTRRCVPSRAVFIMSSSSGRTSDSGWSSVSDSAWPISFSAERFRMPTLPEASTPMMPALADDSTASMKRRRLSIRSEALTSSSRWVRSSRRHLVEGLAELREVAFGLGGPAPGRADRRSKRYWPRSSDCGSAPPASWRNSVRSAPTAIRMVSAITANISAKATWMPSRRASIWAYSATLAAVCLNWLDHARIEQACDVKRRYRRRRAAGSPPRHSWLPGRPRSAARLHLTLLRSPAAAS